MKQFATYEEENIHYWTNRASGYSTVNQEELASDQKTVWRGVISGRIAARFPDRCPEEIRVLDVGTGPGFFAIILAELGYQVTAVDIRRRCWKKRGTMPVHWQSIFTFSR